MNTVLAMQIGGITLFADPISNNGDLLDNLIYATVVLFILSVITEKFTQMTRAYPRQFRYIGLMTCIIFYIPIFIAIKDVNEEKTLTFMSTLLLYISNTLALLLLLANDNMVSESDQQTEKQKSKTFFSWLNIPCNIEKQKTNATEDVIEKEVTILSFIVGFLVAYTFNEQRSKRRKGPHWRPLRQALLLQ